MEMNNSVFIGTELPQVTELKARLAKAEAERAASNAQLASVLHDIHRVEAERDAARERVKHCETRMMRYAIELAEMQAERDAAQAGEARAVEALRRIRGEDIHPDADGMIEDATCFYCHRNSVDGCDEDCPRVIAAEVIDSAQPTLDWLAQQRREAAAEENERWANEWWDMKEDMTASVFTARAAALRAVEVPNE